MDVNTSGTLGDAFIIFLKLYGKKIHSINHFTIHKKVYPKIKDIFSLLGDVDFRISPKRQFDEIKGFIENNESYCASPNIDLPCVDKFNLPKDYTVVQLQSGVEISRTPWKQLKQKDIDSVNFTLPIVLVGTDSKRIRFKKNINVIDIRNETTLYECFSIIKGAKIFYGVQGVMSFFALSQKIKSNIWINNRSDRHAVKHRIDKIKEWKKYVTYYGNY